MKRAADFQWIAGDQSMPADLRGAVVAIGNFDGVHRGHQAVLDSALALAKDMRAPALVLTFETHPREYFQPQTPLFVLTPPSTKGLLLQNLGFHAGILMAFNAELAKLSAEDFVEQILVRQLGVRHVVTGFDFHFGKDRKGTCTFLREAGRAHGFGVSAVEAFCDEGAAPISSSRIRALLASGDLAEANGLLGYRYTVQGEVIHGRKLGRELNFPTANMAFPASFALRHGIYAVRLRRADGSLHDGVASMGTRPTVTEHGHPLLETYIFDFDADLYGETCAVSLFSYLRPELKFDGLETLKKQIGADSESARASLQGVQPLSSLDRRVTFAD